MGTETGQCDLDLTDPLVREVADRSHTPREMWTVGGQLLALVCGECGRAWPCPVRVALRAG